MTPTGQPVAPDDLLLAAGAVVVPDRVLRPGWLQVRDGRLLAVGAGRPPRPPDLDLPEGWLLPGFVDMHSHGGGGGDFPSGRPEDAATAVAFHRGHGTTTMVASLVTAELPALETAVSALADVADDGLLAGIHLEGPWLSPARAGAHAVRLLRHPDPHEVDRLLRAARGHLTMVTLAPELPGGLDAVAQVTAAGGIAAVGHTAADHQTTVRAVEAGARVATHLFNAMPSVHHRAPGPVPALLTAESVSVELILDGVHLHPAVAALAARAAGRHRTVLVTDAIAAAGTGDGARQLGGLAVDVHEGVARLAGTDTIAGSTLTMDRAWAFAVRACGLPPEDASLAASTNPARLLGLADVTGALVPGLRADVVALDAAWRVRRVLSAGRWVGGTTEGAP